LFDRTPKPCKRTEINSARKTVPAINNTLTEKVFPYTMCVLTLEKFKFMTTRGHTRTENKQIHAADLYQTKDDFVAPKQVIVVAEVLSYLY